MVEARTPGRRTLITLLLVGLGLLVVVIGIAVPHRHREPTVPDAAAREARHAKAETALEFLQERYEHARHQKAYGRIIPLAAEQAQRYPDHAPSLTFFGMLLSEAGRLEEAYGALQRSLALDPRQAQVHFTCGVLTTKLQQLPAALAHYRTAVALDGDQPIYRVHQAMVHMKMRQMDEARMQLLTALRQDTSLPDGYHGLAELHFMQNRLNLALQQIDKAIERTPIKQRQKQVKYLRKKAWILRRGNRWGDALRTLDKLTGKERRDPQVLEEMAVNLRHTKGPEAAAGVWAEALRQEPRWEYAAGAAHWYVEAGRPAEARRHLNALSMMRPDAAQIGPLEKSIARAEAGGARRRGPVSDPRPETAMKDRS